MRASANPLIPSCPFQPGKNTVSYKEDICLQAETSVLTVRPQGDTRRGNVSGMEAAAAVSAPQPLLLRPSA